MFAALRFIACPSRLWQPTVVRIKELFLDKNQNVMVNKPIVHGGEKQGRNSLNLHGVSDLSEN